MQSKTREQLVKMYLDALKENKIPWRERWYSDLNKNGVTNTEYRGVNQLILSYVAYKEKYKDNRWLTYKQIKENNYKITNAKGKGVPIEFWSVYDIKNKIRLDFPTYEKIIEKTPERKKDFKVFCNTTYVFNASLIEGIKPNEKNNRNTIPTNIYFKRLISKLHIEYIEEGNKAYYIPSKDTIVLPPSSKFFDKYSYYATQLHELSHATGHSSRLNRNLNNQNKKDYAREELIAEISSSFLMQKLNVKVHEDDYNNHKSYIQSWILLLEDKPNELFKAVGEANKICDYLDSKVKNKEKERM
ncbi:TPA: DUF1738 domain-containing protein [Candidatus Ventrenecus stercoripullorum]|nr:DUF1738 domain-containing protein [Candidatus Ventrenecus stercoripullorum]